MMLFTTDIIYFVCQVDCWHESCRRKGDVWYRRQRRSRSWGNVREGELETWHSGTTNYISCLQPNYPLYNSAVTINYRIQIIFALHSPRKREGRIVCRRISSTYHEAFWIFSIIFQVINLRVWSIVIKE